MKERSRKHRHVFLIFSLWSRLTDYFVPEGLERALKVTGDSIAVCPIAKLYQTARSKLQIGKSTLKSQHKGWKMQEWALFLFCGSREQIPRLFAQTCPPSPLHRLRCSLRRRLHCPLHCWPSFSTPGRARASLDTIGRNQHCIISTFLDIKSWAPFMAVFWLLIYFAIHQMTLFCS